MPWFSFSINDDPSQPDSQTGHIEAHDVFDEVAKIDDQRVNVYELPPDFEPDTQRAAAMSG